MNLLIIEDDDSLREVVAFMLESELAVEVRLASSVAEAQALLTQETEFSAIICDFQLGDGTGEEVFAFLQTLEKRPPFILWSASDPSRHPFFKQPGIEAIIPKSEPHDQLLGAVRKALGTRKKSAQPRRSEYCRIRISTILRQGRVLCDLYLKLSEERFIRVLRAGDDFGSEDFDRFKDKGMAFLYLKREDAEKVVEMLMLELSKLESSSTTAAEIYEVSVTTMEVISNLTAALGFTEEVQKLTQASVTLAVKSIQANPVLSQLLDRLMMDPERYLASHSVILSYLACGIAGLLDWKSETTFYKLTLASFLHDVLVTDQELARKQTNAEVYSCIGKFSAEVVQEYLDHPKACAELIRGMKDVPPDVDAIVLQHHERPDGSGFPAGATYATISPLGAVMILAQELLRFREASGLKSLEPEDMRRFMDELPPDYQRGSFKSVFVKLDESLNKRLGS